MTMPASSLRPVPPRQASLRLGPRPLALHLANATGAWMSSRAALPLLKSGLLPWRPEFALQGGSLSLALAGAKSDSVDAALDEELRYRATRFLDGVERYRAHPYRRNLAEPTLLWQEG